MDECLEAFSDELGILPPVLWAPACDLATRLCLWTAELRSSHFRQVLWRVAGLEGSWAGRGDSCLPQGSRDGTGHMSIPSPAPAKNFKTSAPPLNNSQLYVLTD